MSQATDRTGKIVVNNDEWTLSDAGFKNAPDAGRFLVNMARWFAGNTAGKFLVYSTNFGLTGAAFVKALRDAGHSVTVAMNTAFNVPTLLTYDGVFLAGNHADNNVLIDYVRAGGNVYLAGGTGQGGSAAEAGRWKTFLNAFGFRFDSRYNGVSGARPVQGDHPILAGVSALYFNNGNSVVDIDPEATINQVLLADPSRGGLIAVLDLGLAKVDVRISDICYDGKVKRVEADEFVEIVNQGSVNADISGWKLHADDSGQSFVFPAGTVLKAGQSCRVYTNEVHPDTGGFSFAIGRAIWNNQGDVGRLHDAEGTLVSELAYPVAPAA